MPCVFFFKGCAGSSLLHGLFFSCGKQGLASSWDLPLVGVHRLLIAVVSLVAKQGLLGTQASEVAVPRHWSPGSIAVTQGLSCSVACGVLPDQGLSPCSLLAGRFFATEPSEKPCPVS